jgi:hypothetical protein
MALIPVYFEYITGFRRRFLLGARLTGGWNGQGHRSDHWTLVSMTLLVKSSQCNFYYY